MPPQPVAAGPAIHHARRRPRPESGVVAPDKHLPAGSIIALISEINGADSEAAFPLEYFCMR
jgi:hypothetical protein